MGFRYRSRIRLGKGLWINLSKSGPSISAKAGPLTVNSRGRETIHVAPGLSYTTHAPHTTATRPPAHSRANEHPRELNSSVSATQNEIQPSRHQLHHSPTAGHAAGPKPVSKGVFRTLQALCWVSAAVVLVLALAGLWPAAVGYGLLVALTALATHSMRSRVVWHRLQNESHSAPGDPGQGSA